jgi:hypothetical protein
VGSKIPTFKLIYKEGSMANIFTGESYRIIDCTKNSEFQNLSDNHKEWYKIFVSAGRLNLSAGSFARDKLWVMFPEDTETGAKLRDYTNGLTPPPYTPNPE